MPTVTLHSKNNTREQHQRQYKHPSYHHLYDRQWGKARLVFLQQNPLCAACNDKGIVKGAQVVDHIKRHEGDRKLFWDNKNWQALCKPCHDRKTAIEVGFVKARQT